MKLLADMSLEEITADFLAEGLPKYRAKQVYKWVMRGVGFDGMTDIDKATRSFLSQKYIACPLTIIKNSCPPTRRKNIYTDCMTAM